MNRLVVIAIIVVSVICLIPIKKLAYVKTVLAVITFSAIIGMVGGQVIDNIFTCPVQDGTDLLIKVVATGEKNNQAEGNEIWIQSIKLNDSEYPVNIFFKKSSWIQQNGLLGWREYDQPKNLTSIIQGSMPQGNALTILFTKNKWRGIAEVTVGNETRRIDCYSTQETDEELPIVFQSVGTPVPDAGSIVKHTEFIVSVAAFVILSLAVYIGAKKKAITSAILNQTRSREVWIDLLKLISIVFIVIIHRSGSGFGEFSDSNGWYKQLLVESMTRFSVPCFMMVSGYLAISKDESTTKSLNRTIRMAVLYLLWSLIYVLFDLYFGKSPSLDLIINIPFGRNPAHLWYVYELIWFYLMLPLFQEIRRSVPTKYVWGFIYAALVAPSIIDTLIRLISPSAGDILVVGWSHMGITELSLFLLGWLLIDRVKEKPIKQYILVLYAISGFILTVVLSYIATRSTGRSYSEFFFQGRFPATLFGCSVFLIFHTLEPRLQRLSERMKSIISGASSIIMGVYFVHIISLKMLEKMEITGLRGAFLGVVFSFAICIIAAQIPYFRKLVQ